MRAIGLPLKRVRFEANAWFDEAVLRQRLPLQRGAPLTQAQLDGRAGHPADGDLQ
jgi:hypothetical protein